MNPTIIWIASYPKSGNTWMRAFLVNYLRDTDEPANINSLGQISSITVRGLFDQIAGFSSALLSDEQVAPLRPAVLRYYAESDPEIKFLKVHEAYYPTGEEDPLFPSEITKGAIYIIRNPLDVAVSFAHHREETIDDTIFMMAAENATLANLPTSLQSSFPQPISSWNNHVLSWINCTALPVHIVRYEDMLLDPMKAFREVIRFTELPYDETRLEKAIRFSNFKELRRQEEERSFRERLGGGYFFRSGRNGSWRDSLTDEQIAAIVDSHGEVMHQFGYFPLCE